MAVWVDDLDFGWCSLLERDGIGFWAWKMGAGVRCIYTYNGNHIL